MRKLLTFLLLIFCFAFSGASHYVVVTIDWGSCSNAPTVNQREYGQSTGGYGGGSINVGSGPHYIQIAFDRSVHLDTSAGGSTCNAQDFSLGDDSQDVYFNYDSSCGCGSGSYCSTNVTFAVRGVPVYAYYYVVDTASGIAGSPVILSRGQLGYVSVENIPCSDVASCVVRMMVGEVPNSSDPVQVSTYVGGDMGTTNPPVRPGTISTPNIYFDPNNPLNSGTNSPIEFSPSASTNAAVASTQGASAIYKAITDASQQAHADAEKIAGKIGGTGTNVFNGASNVWVNNFPSYSNVLSNIETNTRANTNSWNSFTNFMNGMSWTNAAYAASSSFRSAFGDLYGTAPGIPTVPSPADGSVDLEVYNGFRTIHIDTSRVPGLSSIKNPSLALIAGVIWLVTFAAMLKHSSKSYFRLLNQRQMQGNNQTANFLGIGGNADIVTGYAYAAVMAAFIVSLPVAMVGYFTTVRGNVSGIGAAISTISSSPMWNIVTTFLPVGEIVTAFFTWLVFRFFICDLLVGSLAIIIVFFIA